MTSWPGRGQWLYAIAAGALLAAAVAVVLIAPLNTDTAWMLVEARRLTHGERLYVDIMETNPPLVVWLWMLPAVIGNGLGWGDARISAVTVAMVLAAVTLVSFAVIDRAPAASRLVRLALVAGFLVPVVLLCLWDMGEREQIAAMLTLPYAFLAARAVMPPGPESGAARSDRGVALDAASMAAVAFALKPFFLGAFAAIELAVLWSAGWRRAAARIEPWTIAIGQAIYVVVVLVVTPEYASRTVPVVIATYGAYGNGIAAVVRSSRFWLSASVGVIALSASALSAATFPGACARVFGAATLGWLLGYAVQGKGWQYHFIPVMVFGATAIAATIVAIGAAVRTLPRRSRVARVAIGGAALAFLVVAPVAAGSAWRLAMKGIAGLRAGDRAEVVVLIEVVSQLATGEPVFALSTNMAPAFPVVNLAGAEWPYHYHFLWLLPGLYPGATGTPIPYRAPAEQDAMERAFFDTVVSDLEHIPPRALIVDRSRDMQGMAYGRPFDFLRYFSSSPRFVELMRRYRRAAAVGPYDVYERVR